MPIKKMIEVLSKTSDDIWLKPVVLAFSAVSLFSLL